MPYMATDSIPITCESCPKHNTCTTTCSEIEIQLPQYKAPAEEVLFGETYILDNMVTEYIKSIGIPIKPDKAKIDLALQTFKSLPDKERMSIYFCYVHNYSEIQMSELMGISIRQVRRIKRNALEVLKA